MASTVLILAVVVCVVAVGLAGSSCMENCEQPPAERDWMVVSAVTAVLVAAGAMVLANADRRRWALATLLALVPIYGVGVALASVALA